MASDKALESKHDTTSSCGFSTDQRIDIESLDVQKEAMQDRKREAALVGLLIEESAIAEHIEGAERRAQSRCLEYDPMNVYWKRVDILLEEQDNILGRIRKFNESMVNDETKTSVTVSSFVNEPSPDKRSNKNAHEEIIVPDDNDESASSGCDDNVSISVKKVVKVKKSTSKVSQVTHNN